MNLRDDLLIALECVGRGVGNTVTPARRDELSDLDLIAPGRYDDWPYWHLTPAGWRALGTGTTENHPDDYCDQIADARRDEGV